MAATEPTPARPRRWPLSGLATAYLALFLVFFVLELPARAGFVKVNDGSLAGMYSYMIVGPVVMLLFTVTALFFPSGLSGGLPGGRAGEIVLLLLSAAIMSGIIEVGVRLVRRIGRRPKSG